MNRPLVAAALLALTMSASGVRAQVTSASFPHPDPAPVLPTPTYQPVFPASGAGQVYSGTTSAGPDDSFFVAGAGLGRTVTLWGPGETGTGRAEAMTVRASAPDHLIATLPQNIPDGLFVGQIGGSAPFRLNAPQPWWCTPDRAAPGETVDLFGDELAERPDRARAWVYVAKHGQAGAWVTPAIVSRYRVGWRAPSAPGRYEVWVYAGTGGAWGWGGPVALEVRPVALSRMPPILMQVGSNSAAIQTALDRGGVVHLAPGTYALECNLVISAGSCLEGAGRAQTTLKLAAPAGTPLRRLGASGWGQAVGGLQDAGDTLTYKVAAPASGAWTIWVRYAASNATPMSGRTTLAVEGGGPPTPLQDLADTGDWGKFRWASAGTITLKQGTNTVRWATQGGGGINLDAFVFARDPAWRPGDLAAIKASPALLVQQAEDVSGSRTVQAQFPGGDAAAVWLAGDGASLAGLTVLGSPRVSTGVLVAHPQGHVLQDARVENVRVAGVEGTTGENSAVYVVNGRGVTVADCDLTGRAPLRFEGMTQGRIRGNQLHAVTRFGGNAEAAILGRTHALHQNVIEGNVADSPDAGGGPTARRLLWFSTGAGSVSDNYIAGNVGRTRFGGVAGTDQNVGETILFETNMRVAYYGSPESATGAGVTLPPSGPFVPPLVSDDVEPPQDEYYVYVVRGRGLGQVRRVVGRQGRTLTLDQPWAVPPDGHSLVLEALSFAHNIAVGNRLPDGMSGIQLWIGGYRNIFADNEIAGERKEGIYLYGAMSTAGPAMPNTWNAGIGPLFYNTVEGNRISETDRGIRLGIEDDPQASCSVDWPRALGTVLRHNSMTQSRTAGLSISAGAARPEDPADLAIEGTIAEFNFVRDAPVGYEAGPRTVGTVLRRDLAYFWNWTPNAPPKAFATAGAREAIGADNTVEGHDGGDDGRIGNDLTPKKP